MSQGVSSEIYCADLVKQFDPDRYLATLYAPDEKRSALFALYAFSLEIARIRESVSEPMLGEIRLQWWRDTLGAIYSGQSQEHPVAEALSDAIKSGDVPQQALQNLIEARVFDLYDDPMPNVNDLEGYLGETSS
ncbi:MAG: phytoene/squalene synthase family protein, partial [Hyphomicrobiales bacterium]